VETLLESGAFTDRDKLLDTAIRANIRSSVQHLRQGSLILEGLIANSGLRVVGAEYSLATGAVDFFDTLDVEAQA
jgi:carbonic anhydrase